MTIFSFPGVAIQGVDIEEINLSLILLEQASHPQEFAILPEYTDPESL